MARALSALDKRGPVKQRLLIELEAVEHDVTALKGAVTCSGVKVLVRPPMEPPAQAAESTSAELVPVFGALLNLGSNARLGS